MEDFFSKKIYRLNNLKRAVCTSSEDVLTDGLNLFKEPQLKNYFRLQKKIFNSSTWIGKSGIRLMWPKEKKLCSQREFLAENKTQDILKAVNDGKRLEHSYANQQEIFNAIFTDLDYSRKNSRYRSKLSSSSECPPIMLVSGVLNEIFSTAAFERGAKYLEKNYNNKYYICRTSRLKE